VMYPYPTLFYTKTVRLVKGEDSLAYKRALVSFGNPDWRLGSLDMTLKESYWKHVAIAL
jgi:hypothetical protein